MSHWISRHDPSGFDRRLLQMLWTNKSMVDTNFCECQSSECVSEHSPRATNHGRNREIVSCRGKRKHDWILSRLRIFLSLAQHQICSAAIEHQQALRSDAVATRPW